MVLEEGVCTFVFINRKTGLLNNMINEWMNCECQGAFNECGHEFRTLEWRSLIAVPTARAGQSLPLPALRCRGTVNNSLMRHTYR